MALHAAIGVERAWDVPTTFPWWLFAPHTYWHASVCLDLIICCGLGLFVTCDPIAHCQFQMSASLGMLWVGVGVPGTLFCAAIFACVEGYAGAIYASYLLSPGRRDWQIPVISPLPGTVLQAVKRCLGNILQGMPPAPSLTCYDWFLFPPLPQAVLGWQPWP